MTSTSSGRSRCARRQPTRRSDGSLARPAPGRPRPRRRSARSPPTSSSTSPAERGSCSSAASTAATSARVTLPRGTRSLELHRPGRPLVGQAARPQDRPVEVARPQVELGSPLGDEVGGEHLVGSRRRGRAGAHRGDQDVAAHARLLGAVGQQTGSRPVHGVLARDPAARPGARREHHRVRARRPPRRRPARSTAPGPGPPPRRRRPTTSSTCPSWRTSASGHVPAGGQRAREVPSDLPVATRDRDAHVTHGKQRVGPGDRGRCRARTPCARARQRASAGVLSQAVRTCERGAGGVSRSPRRWMSSEPAGARESAAYDSAPGISSSANSWSSSATSARSPAPRPVCAGRLTYSTQARRSGRWCEGPIGVVPWDVSGARRRPVGGARVVGR